MSVKIYDKEQNKWVIFPGTIGAPGKDAYLIAQENGYTGTKEEYNYALTNIPKVVESINNTDEIPTQNSNNLVQSGGTWQAIKVVKDQVDVLTNSVADDLNKIKITEIPNQIKTSIIDNLDSSTTDQSLSANQGRILKEMISNLTNLHLQIIEELPEHGEANIIYLIKKDGEENDIYDQYVYIEDKWEKIGNTNIDLSNYYTKTDIYNKLEIDSKLSNQKWGYASLSTTTTPGNYGICDKSTSSSSITITSTDLSNSKQVSILVVRGNVNVTFNNDKFKLSNNIDEIQGTSSQYKCYYLQYINDNLILVNCSIYS